MAAHSGVEVGRRAVVLGLGAVALPWTPSWAQRAVSRQPLLAVTLNDSYENPGSDIAYAATFAQVLFLQEATALGVATALPGWPVAQDVTDPLTASTAIAVRPGVEFTVQARGYVPLLDNHGPGHGIATMRGTYAGTPVELISAHRPPGTRKDLWPEFDRLLTAYVQLVKATGRLVVIGMDANQQTPQGLADQMNLTLLTPYDASIDLFLVSRRIVALEATATLRRRSDHHPVLGVLRVPTS